MKVLITLLALSAGLAVVGAQTESGSNNFQKLFDSYHNLRGGPTCALCKTIVKEVSHFLKDNRTEEAIENALGRVCDTIFKDGDPKQQQCDDMVKAYTKEFCQLLADETDPEVICMLIEQCTYQAEGILSTFQALMPKKELPPVKIPTIGELITMLDPEIPLNSMKTCVECKLFISYLQDTFESPRNRDTLRQWLLDNLCDTLGDGAARKSCAQMVNRYSEDFFKAIAEEMDPKSVCADLKACKKKFSFMEVIQEKPYPEPEILEEQPSSTPTSESHEYYSELSTADILEDVMVPEGDKIICDECVEIVTKLDEYLSTHAIDQDVSELINQVCNKISYKPTQESCAKIVKTIGEELVEKLHTMDNPKQFCTDVANLC